MGKGKDYEEEISKAREARQDGGTGGKWGQPPKGGRKETNPNLKSQYSEKGMFGGETTYYGKAAGKHSKNHKW